MGKLSDDESAMLEKLLAQRDAPDGGDDDDEIEWWEEDEGGKRRGGRMSVKRAKSTGLFSDLFGEKAPPAEGGNGDGKPPAKQRTSEKYFGRGSGQKEE